jgi:hypothetical protein
VKPQEKIMKKTLLLITTLLFFNLAHASTVYLGSTGLSVVIRSQVMPENCDLNESNSTETKFEILCKNLELNPSGFGLKILIDTEKSYINAVVKRPEDSEFGTFPIISSMGLDFQTQEGSRKALSFTIPGKGFFTIFIYN